MPVGYWGNWMGFGQATVMNTVHRNQPQNIITVKLQLVHPASGISLTYTSDILTDHQVTTYVSTSV